MEGTNIYEIITTTLDQIFLKNVNLVGEIMILFMKQYWIRYICRKVSIADNFASLEISEGKNFLIYVSNGFCEGIPAFQVIYIICILQYIGILDHTQFFSHYNFGITIWNIS